jgi:hypothetical protein
VYAPPAFLDDTAAKVLRAPPLEGFTLPELPPKSALVQQGQGLAKLSDDAFGAVVNGVVPAPYAAEVGRAISDPAQQMAAIQILHQAEPANAEQARLLVQDVKNSGFLDGTQEDMFGSQAFAQSLFPERAKVLGQALQTLRGNKKVFQSAVAGEDTLTAAGNTLDTEANQKGQTENERLIDTLQRSGTSRGPISDALSAAARDVASGKQVRGASADFLAKARALVRSGTGVGLEHGADNERAGQAGAAGADGAAAAGVKHESGIDLQKAGETKAVALADHSRMGSMPVEDVAVGKQENNIRPTRPQERFLSNRQGAAGAGATDTPAHFPAFQAVAEHVMRLAGVPKSVTLKLFERLNDGTADGSYAAGLLKFALDTNPSDIPAKFFHEIVHALRDPALGLLKPGERAALDRAAPRAVRAGLDVAARIKRSTYDAANRYYNDVLARILDTGRFIDYTSSLKMPSEIAKVA